MQRATVVIRVQSSEYTCCMLHVACWEGGKIKARTRLILDAPSRGVVGYCRSI